MIALVRAEDIKLISDGADGWIDVPDIKLPQGVEWSAYAIKGMPAFHFFFSHGGVEVASTWHGPHTVAGQKLFFVEIPDDSEKTMLGKLRNQLGTENCAPLIRVLRLQNAKGAAVRAYCKTLVAAGVLNPIYNSNGRIVGLHAPLVIAGRGGADMDGDDLEAAEILTELE